MLYSCTVNLAEQHFSTLSQSWTVSSRSCYSWEVWLSPQPISCRSQLVHDVIHLAIFLCFPPVLSSSTFTSQPIDWSRYPICPRFNQLALSLLPFNLIQSLVYDSLIGFHNPSRSIAFHSLVYDSLIGSS
jgi:hypothetical protein